MIPKAFVVTVTRHVTVISVGDTATGPLVWLWFVLYSRWQEKLVSSEAGETDRGFLFPTHAPRGPSSPVGAQATYMHCSRPRAGRTWQPALDGGPAPGLPSPPPWWRVNLNDSDLLEKVTKRDGTLRWLPDSG